MNELAKGTAAAARPGAKDGGSGSSCIAFVVDEATRNTVQTVCQTRHDRLTVREGGSREALDYATRYALPRILIIDVSDSERPLEVLSPILAAADENTRIIAIGAVNDVTLYRELMDAGVVDYLVKPLNDRSFLAAIQHADARDAPARPGAAPPERARLVAVVGARGGVGASTLAANLAWFLAEQHKRKTTLLDLDLQFGTASLAFDVEPSRGLRDALEQPNRIDALLINSAAVRHSERLTILASEESHEEDIRYDPTAVTLLLDELSRQAEFVIVDVPLHPSAYRAKVLPLARDIVIVTDLSLAGLRDAIRLSTQAQQLTQNARLLVVASRTGGRASGVSVREFEKALGRKIDTLLPEDPKAVAQSSVQGKPLAQSARGSKLTTGLRDLARQINDTRPKAKQPRRSIWPWAAKE
jgi:pilus assembly protein CpaE